MPKRKWPAKTCTAFLLLALLVGFLHFAGLTVPTSYPDMSSLNSGPNGTKLLFDAFAKMAPLSVHRNYLPISQWHPSSATILFLAVSPSAINAFDKNDLSDLGRLAEAHNRIVLAIPDDASVNSPDRKKPVLIKTRWGIQILKRDKKDKSDDEPLLLDHDASWQPSDGLDDAVEKRFGANGAIVIALHSDDFSNKSLATDKAVLDEIPPLIGRSTSIAFDETHLGIEESGSIAGLVRRFKLQGVLAGLLFLLALFIWNQSVSFPPPSVRQTGKDSQVLGADARGIFASLIARHLTPQTLIESCVSEWNRVKPQQRIAAEFSSEFDPVAHYRQLQETLQKKRSRL